MSTRTPVSSSFTFTFTFSAAASSAGRPADSRHWLTRMLHCGSSPHDLERLCSSCSWIIAGAGPHGLRAAAAGGLWHRRDRAGSAGAPGRGPDRGSLRGRRVDRRPLGVARQMGVVPRILGAAARWLGVGAAPLGGGGTPLAVRAGPLAPCLICPSIRNIIEVVPTQKRANERYKVEVDVEVRLGERTFPSRARNLS